LPRHSASGLRWRPQRRVRLFEGSRAWRRTCVAGPPVLPVAGRPALGGGPAVAAGEAWVDLQGAFSCATRPAPLLESTARGCPWRRLVSAGFDRQAFFAELFRGRACGWRERVGFSLVFPAGLLCGWRWGQRHQGQPCRLHPEEGPGGRRGPRGSFLRLGLCTVIAGWQLHLISRVAPGGLCEVCHPMRWGSLRTVLRGTSGALVRWVEACQGWLAGPDGPEAFSFSS